MAHSAMITAGIARLAVTGAVAVVIAAIAGTITAVPWAIVVAIRAARAVAVVVAAVPGAITAVAGIARTLVAIRVSRTVAAIIIVTVVSAAVCAPRGGWTRNLSFGVGSENHSHSN